MRLHRLFWPAWAASASALNVNWIENQVNNTLCVWKQPRAALIRDTVYFDGGDIYWMAGLADGQYAQPNSMENFEGIIFTYNLSNPFDADTNFTKIITENPISKALGGEGSANSAPNFIDGGILANDAEFFMYGGAYIRNRKIYDDPDADFVLGYQLYEYGVDKGVWGPSFDDKDLPEEVNRYISYGAAVSAPSENKAWYFSGMTTPTKGDIWVNPDPEGENRAQNISNTLIQLDMEVQGEEEWTNSTFDPDKDKVRGRANAEVVWVPVGEQGILVVLGGVVYPDWAGVIPKSPDEEASQEESPKFLSTIDIYDIANGEWHQQETEKSPKARTRGCAVVAPASDYSSFNIYYYGGYDGIDLIDPFYDEVWVLSLPSFTWTLLNEGEDLHARAGHKCFMPYPDQMIAFGGDTSKAGRTKSCLDKGPLIVFNLTSGEWMESYHPDSHGDYGVPSKVHEIIGGDASGGATLTTPSPSGWASDELEDLFSSTYDMDKIKTWGPYPAIETESDRPDLPDDGDGGGGGSGLPSWVAPVLGVVLGLMAVTAAVVVFCLWRRRKYLKNHSSDYGTEDTRNKIISWIRGQPTEKAPTVATSEDTPMSPDMAEVKAVAAPVSSPTSPPPEHHEMAGTPIAELDDTSPPAELSDTGLGHSEVIQKHSRLGSNKTRSMSHQSYSSFSGATNDYQSIVSGDEGRADSPSLPNTPEPGQSQGQMQSLSETLAESGADRPSQDRRVSDQVTPVSPPTAGDSPGEDYISARDTQVSPLRRSVFHEHEEDLGKNE